MSNFINYRKMQSRVLDQFVDYKREKGLILVINKNHKSKYLTIRLIRNPLYSGWNLIWKKWEKKIILLFSLFNFYIFNKKQHCLFTLHYSIKYICIYKHISTHEHEFFLVNKYIHKNDEHIKYLPVCCFCV